MSTISPEVAQEWPGPIPEHSVTYADLCVVMLGASFAANTGSYPWRTCRDPQRTELLHTFPAPQALSANVGPGPKVSNLRQVVANFGPTPDNLGRGRPSLDQALGQCWPSAANKLTDATRSRPALAEIECGGNFLDSSFRRSRQIATGIFQHAKVRNFRATSPSRTSSTFPEPSMPKLRTVSKGSWHRRHPQQSLHEAGQTPVASNGDEHI